MVDQTMESGAPLRNEATPLLPSASTGTSNYQVSRFHCVCRGAFCVKSKAAILILVWSAIIAMLQACLDEPNTIFQAIYPNDMLFQTILASGWYGIFAVVLMFYPLAGFLADVCCGRYKTVVCSAWIITIGLVLGGCVAAVFIKYNPIKYNDSLDNNHIIVITFFVIGLIPLLVGIVGFSANVIQFGMDQLQDSPAEDSSLYIYWYIWTYMIGNLVFQMSAGVSLPHLPTCLSESFLMYNTCMGDSHNNIFFLNVIPGFLLSCFPFLLMLTCCRHPRSWFIIDGGSRNPYKLVYKVLKFAYKHTHPIRRSAFTYCEDDLPSRIDLGKNKYGGPFTTEEVEDVKTFIGILKVLLALGPFFMVEVAADSVLSFRQNIRWIEVCNSHKTNSDINLVGSILLSVGLPTPILVVVSIPVYIFLLKPFFHHYLPGMLKRMGLGMLLFLFSLIVTLSTDHLYFNALCNYYYDNNIIIIGFNQTMPTTTLNDVVLLLPQNFLNALGYMLFYIAAYEFVCAQSPHAMKGLIIGVFFAVKGFFRVVGVSTILLPYIITVQDVLTNWFATKVGCGFVYYLVNIVVAIVAIMAYIFVARRYKNRERDEPCNVRQFVEHYYEQTQDEPRYDFNDSNELDVHTVH